MTVVARTSSYETLLVSTTFKRDIEYIEERTNDIRPPSGEILNILKHEQKTFDLKRGSGLEGGCRHILSQLLKEAEKVKLTKKEKAKSCVFLVPGDR